MASRSSGKDSHCHAKPPPPAPRYLSTCVCRAVSISPNLKVHYRSSSGDGGSHWSFGEFDPENPMGAVLNKIGCKFQFPIYPSPSPYMISVGGTMWAGDDPAGEPVFWDTHSGTGKLQRFGSAEEDAGTRT